MKINESFVDRIHFHVGHHLGNGFHYAVRHITVQGVVGRKDLYVMFRKKVFIFKRQSTHFDAEGFGFVGAGNDAAVIIGEDHHGFTVHLDVKNPFTTHIKIITIYQSEHIRAD